jgi:hypothetical protein
MSRTISRSGNRDGKEPKNLLAFTLTGAMVSILAGCFPAYTNANVNASPASTNAHPSLVAFHQRARGLAVTDTKLADEIRRFSIDETRGGDAAQLAYLMVDRLVHVFLPWACEAAGVDDLAQRLRALPPTTNALGVTLALRQSDLGAMAGRKMQKSPLGYYGPQESRRALELSLREGGLAVALAGGIAEAKTPEKATEAAYLAADQMAITIEVVLRTKQAACNEIMEADAAALRSGDYHGVHGPDCIAESDKVASDALTLLRDLVSAARGPRASVAGATTQEASFDIECDAEPARCFSDMQAVGLHTSVAAICRRGLQDPPKMPTNKMQACLLQLPVALYLADDRTGAAELMAGYCAKLVAAKKVEQVAKVACIPASIRARVTAASALSKNVASATTVFAEMCQVDQAQVEKAMRRICLDVR